MTNIRYNGKEYYAVEIGGKITVVKNSDGGLDLFTLDRMIHAADTDLYVKSYAVSSSPVSSDIYPTRVIIGGSQHGKSNAAPQGTFLQPVTYSEPLKVTNNKLSFSVHNNNATTDIDVYYYFLLYSEKYIDQQNQEYPLIGEHGPGGLNLESTQVAVAASVASLDTKEGVTGEAADVDGARAGQLRYIGEAGEASRALLATIDADTGNIATSTGSLDTKEGVTGEAADVDGARAGQLRYIGEALDKMRNLASGTYHTEVSIKLTLNQAEQRIDNVASLFTTKLSEIATAGFKVTDLKVTSTAGSWASQEAYLDIRRDYTTVKRVTGLHMVTGFVNLGGTEPNNTLAPNGLYVCSFNSTEEVIITVGVDYNVS
jgi:hypothetical protein